MKRLLFLLFVSLNLCSIAQNADEDLIQFSGVVVSRDSLSPIPFATILVKNTNRGTTSDYYGYFSFVAKPGDTLVFSSVGYKKSYFMVSDSLAGERYSLIQAMLRDTIELDMVNIYPWPSAEDFKEAFLALDVPDDDLEIARKNLSPAILAERSAAMPMNGSLNFKWQMQQQMSQLYFAGQYRPIQLFNPIAWAQFIQAWKRGDFKRKP